MIFLLLSLSMLFNGVGSVYQRTGSCSYSHFKYLDELENYKVSSSISRTNGQCYGTNSLRVLHNGVVKEIEPFECNHDSRTLSYKLKGTQDSVNFGNVDDVRFFCGAPIPRVCDNPTSYCRRYDCPKYTPGSETDAAKFECPNDKWLIDSKDYILKPVCKTKAGEHRPHFYANLSNDIGCKNPNCNNSDCPTFTHSSRNEAAKIECPDDKWIIKSQEYTLKPVCKVGPEIGKAEFYATLPDGSEVALDSFVFFGCKGNGSEEQRSGDYTTFYVVLFVVIILIAFLSIGLRCMFGRGRRHVGYY